MGLRLMTRGSSDTLGSRKWKGGHLLGRSVLDCCTRQVTIVQHYVVMVDEVLNMMVLTDSLTMRIPGTKHDFETAQGPHKAGWQ